MHSRRLPISLLLASSVAIACGPATSLAEPVMTEPGTSGPTPGRSTPEAPPAISAATAQASDAADDCFNGFREPTEDCAGLDLLELSVGSAAEAPDFAVGPALEGKLVFVVTFADDLALSQDFGICFHMDLDGDDATGYEDIDMPGLERVFCAFPPDGIAAWYERGALGYDADPTEDESRLKYFIGGNQIVLVFDPALLEDASGAAGGFELYVGTARSINQLDYFNGQGPLHLPEALVVPDEVVEQAP